MAAGQILSRPAAAAGAICTTPGSVWGFSTPWQQLFPASDFPSTDVSLLGLTMQLDKTVAGADSTRELLFEIGTGAAAAEVTKIQVPVSVRADTVVGFIFNAYPTVFFPEPYLVPAGTRVAVRMAGANAGVATIDGIKVFLLENKSVFGDELVWLQAVNRSNVY